MIFGGQNFFGSCKSDSFSETRKDQKLDEKTGFRAQISAQNKRNNNIFYSKISIFDNSNTISNIFSSSRGNNDDSNSQMKR